jgi:hypothetical protein
MISVAVMVVPMAVAAGQISEVEGEARRHPRCCWLWAGGGCFIPRALNRTGRFRGARGVPPRRPIGRQGRVPIPSIRATSNRTWVHSPRRCYGAVRSRQRTRAFHPLGTAVQRLNEILVITISYGPFFSIVPNIGVTHHDIVNSPSSGGIPSESSVTSLRRDPDCGCLGSMPREVCGVIRSGAGTPKRWRRSTR